MSKTYGRYFIKITNVGVLSPLAVLHTHTFNVFSFKISMLLQSYLLLTISSISWEIISTYFINIHILDEYQWGISLILDSILILRWWIPRQYTGSTMYYRGSTWLISPFLYNCQNTTKLKDDTNVLYYITFTTVRLSSIFRFRQTSRH